MNVEKILAAMRSADVDIIDPAAKLCAQTKCPLLYNGQSVYYDDDHLSKAGALMLSPLFTHLFHK